MIRRKNEEVLWQGWTRAGGGFARVSLAGHLRGLEGLPKPGGNVELRPYALLGNDTERDSLSGAFGDTPRRGVG